MKIKSRCTYAFIELKIDEIETTIFKSDKWDVDEHIENLLGIVDDLLKYTDKPLNEFLNQS